MTSDDRFQTLRLPGPENNGEPIQAALTAESEEFARANVSAALNLFLRRS
ncbi:hypothetical protein [Amycolatopsis sp. NPDC054798]